MTRRQVVRARGAACLLFLTVFVGGAVPRSVAAEPDSFAGLPSPARPVGPLVVVGAAGLGPQDVDAARTPNLWALLRDGSSAALNVTAVHGSTCPLDGWLTLSAGNRAGQPDDGTPAPPCGPLPPVQGGVVTGWEVLAAAADRRPYGSKLGTLAQSLAGAGRCLSATGPGAALGAALPGRGAVPGYRPFDQPTLTAALAACPTSLVDVGAVRDPAVRDPAALDPAVRDPAALDPAEAGPDDPAGPARSRAEQVALVDARVGQVVAAAPAGADVVVIGLADSGTRAGLRLALAAGPGFPPGTLTSASTRQPGLVQLADVTATILSRAGVPVPDAVSGSPLERLPAGDGPATVERRHAGLVDADLASQAVQPVVLPFFVTWALLMLVALAALGVMRWRGLGGVGLRRSLRRGVRQGLVVFATVPAASFLANTLPWWRFSRPAVGLVLAVAAWSALLGAAALGGPWRRSVTGPLGAVAAMTMLVLTGDAVTGSRLQISALLGLNPVVGGRYYGLGNVAFALLAAAAYLLAVAVSSRLVHVGRRRLAALSVALVGAVAVVVDAAPAWGSDAGGPPALVPGMAVLVLAVLRVRLGWGRVALVAGGTVLVVLAVAILDWLRPASSRTHLGRFVQSVGDGSAGAVVSRKLAQNVDTLLHSTVFAYAVPLLLVGLVALVWVLGRPDSPLARPLGPLGPLLERVETLQAGLVGLTVTLVVGTLLNDTGVAITPVALALVLPLLVAAGLRAAELGSPPGRVATSVARRA